MNVVSTRVWIALTAVLLLGVVVVVGLVYAKQSDDATVRADEAQVYLLTVDSTVASRNPALAEVQQARSLPDLDKILSEPAVIVVDRSAVGDLAGASLAPYAERGFSIIGLNIPLDQLSDLTGFTEQLRQINPEFAKHQPAPGTFKGEYFTTLWHTPPGAAVQRWSRGQQDLTPGLFVTVLQTQKLASAGLIKDEAGNLIPLEDY